MELITKAPKGTQDLLPKDTDKWLFVEAVMREQAELYGFKEIRTPHFEHTELFLRGVGETSDVVEKQMYTFNDKGDRSITLRPEGTAGVVRAMLQNGLYNDGYPIKLYYFDNCYRYEKPQAGRLREFVQFGVEIFGAKDPIADVQIIMLAKSIFDRLAVEGLSLEINSIGCPNCRPNYHNDLKEYFKSRESELCETCVSRLDKNPMRVLDCKSPICKEIGESAPLMSDYLCEECESHFASVKDYLSSFGAEFTVNPRLVRGLDYYSKTVFELISNDIGAQGTVCGGGRYDTLVEQMGGKETPGLGFGLGMNRLMLVLENNKTELPEAETPELFIASMGDGSVKKAAFLAEELRLCGVYCEHDICGRGLKAQMKYASKIGAKYSIVIGENEIESDKAEIKNMTTGEKTEISLGEEFINEYISVITKDMSIGEILEF